MTYYMFQTAIILLATFVLGAAIGSVFRLWFFPGDRGQYAEGSAAIGGQRARTPEARVLERRQAGQTAAAGAAVATAATATAASYESATARASEVAADDDTSIASVDGAEENNPDARAPIRQDAPPRENNAPGIVPEPIAAPRSVSGIVEAVSSQEESAAGAAAVTEEISHGQAGDALPPEHAADAPQAPEPAPTVAEEKTAAVDDIGARTERRKDRAQNEADTAAIAAAAVAAAAAAAIGQADTAEAEEQPETDTAPAEEDAAVAAVAAAAATPIEPPAPVAPVSPVAPPAPPAPVAPAAPAAPVSYPDDELTRIRGIDAATSAKLKSMGITSYKQIAAFSAADVARVNGAFEHGRVSREGWIEQSQLLKNGVQTLFTRRMQAGGMRLAAVSPAPSNKPRIATEAPAALAAAAAAAAVTAATSPARAVEPAVHEEEDNTPASTANGNTPSTADASDDDHDDDHDVDHDVDHDDDHDVETSADDLDDAADADDGEEFGVTEHLSDADAADEPAPPISDDDADAAHALLDDDTDHEVSDDGRPLLDEEDDVVSRPIDEDKGAAGEGSAVSDIASKVAMAAVAATAAVTASSESEPEPADDLTMIAGIDERTASILGGRGITRFADIEQMSQREIDDVNEALGDSGRVERENWADQASVLARGDRTVFARGRELDSSNAAPTSGAENDREPWEPRADAPTIDTTDVAADTADGDTGPDNADNNDGPSLAEAAASVAGIGAAAATGATRARDDNGANNPRAERPAREGGAGGLRSVRSEALRSGDQENNRRAGGGRLRSGVPDDLKRIRGVGVVIEKKLFQMGITTYQQVATWTPADIDRVSERLDFRGRIERENWIDQARILARGDVTDFARRVDRGEPDA